MEKFEVGKTYCCRSACDHECIYSWTVIKRTAKRLTLLDNDTQKVILRGIYQSYFDPDLEACAPDGHYSLCPIIYANNYLKD